MLRFMPNLFKITPVYISGVIFILEIIVYIVSLIYNVINVIILHRGL
jgi:hypothetical protein